MHDPTRIPRVLDALRAAWEGQPDTSLPTFFGMLANRGISWGATDDELLAVLAEIANEHPADLPPTPEGRAANECVVQTEQPAMHVTFGADWVCVRLSTNPRSQPALWQYTSVRPTGPGRPLVVADTEGVEHRLGVVTLISTLNTAEAPELEGLERPDVGNYLWLAELASGAKAMIGHTIRLWEPDRRSVDLTEYSWHSIRVARVGQDLVVKRAGGVTVNLGQLEHVRLIES